MSKFQIIFIGIAVILILAGVFIFSVSKSSNTSVHPVVMWGTMSQAIFNDYIQKIKEQTGTAPDVTYVQKTKADLEVDFVNALAGGRGPDIVLLPQDLILKHKDKIIPIPFTSYAERTYRDTFIQEGELYLTDTGILGFPLYIDPLVMYWNRSMFTSASIATPPKYWDEYPTLVEKLTVKDNAFNVIKSAVALGEYSNIAHAKEIVATLMFQAGDPIVTTVQGTNQVTLGSMLDYTTPPAESAVSFYTQFSNPSLATYSWNRSLLNSRDAFISEDLATYFGFASELPTLREKNPNLDFDIATLPQARGDKRITYGALQAMSIVRTSKYVQDAYAAIVGLVSAQNMARWNAASHLPPVRRDLLSIKSVDAASSVMYTSALWSKAWLDPDSEQTSKIFQNLIESVSTGRARPNSAVGRAGLELGQLMRK